MSEEFNLDLDRLLADIGEFNTADGKGQIHVEIRAYNGGDPKLVMRWEGRRASGAAYSYPVKRLVKADALNLIELLQSVQAEDFVS